MREHSIRLEWDGPILRWLPLGSRAKVCKMNQDAGLPAIGLQMRRHEWLLGPNEPRTAVREKAGVLRDATPVCTTLVVGRPKKGGCGEAHVWIEGGWGS